MNPRLRPFLRSLLKPASLCPCRRELHTARVQVLSGIQPTGSIHLGNYFGAIRQWVQFQDGLTADLVSPPSSGNVAQGSVHYLPPVIQIVDMHSITTSQGAKSLRDNIFDIAAVLLACGIDPKKCLLFKQSSVPLNGYLCWVLACLSTMPQLNRFPQFKEKSVAFKEPPLGLYIYPILQAADILLYKGTHIPIGDDQLAHLNMAKHLASKFNSVFNADVFPIPIEILPKRGAGRLKSLRAPLKKMSKSEADTKSRIELTDAPDEIVRKIRKAVTDMTSEVTYDPAGRPGVSNLIEIYSIISRLSTEQVCQQFHGKETFQFKVELGDLLAEYVKPIRERILRYSNDRHYLESVLMEGAAKASKIAQETFLQVQQVIGSDMANLTSDTASTVSQKEQQQ